MDNNIVSVIIPIYNVEQYIYRCIESVINQTHKNMEIILVDDGSTDNCPRICDYYAKKDHRIKVLHKTNGGLSSARNEGMKLATARYITFVDGDDIIQKDFVEKMYIMLKKTNADISCCELQGFSSLSSIKNEDSEKYKCIDNICALEKMMYQKGIQNCACAKIYKKELFKDISFPEGKLCEDLATTYKIFASAKRICFTNDRKYYYYQREDSITHRQYNDNRMDGLYYAKEQMDYINMNYYCIINAAVNRLFMEAIYILKNIPINDRYKEELDILKKIITQNRIKVLLDYKSSLKTKIYAMVTFLGISTTQKILNMR